MRSCLMAVRQNYNPTPHAMHRCDDAECPLAEQWSGVQYACRWHCLHLCVGHTWQAQAYCDRMQVPASAIFVKIADKDCSDKNQLHTVHLNFSGWACLADVRALVSLLPQHVSQLCQLCLMLLMVFQCPDSLLQAKHQFTCHARFISL